MDNYLDMANSIWMWIACIPMILVIAFQAIKFTKRAREVSSLVELSKEDSNKAFKIGIISAIGPSLGISIVMLGLIAQIGAPMAWMKLSDIGAAATELVAIESSANIMGTTLGAADYGMKHFTFACWMTAINATGFMLFSAIFSDKLDKLNKKMTGGDPALMGVIGVGALCGAMSHAFSGELVKGLDPETRGFAIAAIGSGICMLILSRIAKKYPKLKQYSLGISMIVGMIITITFNRI